MDLQRRAGLLTVATVLNACIALPDEDVRAPNPSPPIPAVDAAPLTDIESPCVAVPETCDGLDNDCDDLVDESEDEGGVCRCVPAPEIQNPSSNYIDRVEFCNRVASWPTALAACRARGGDLAFIRDSHQWGDLKKALKNSDGAFGAGDQRAWIGLNDRASEGDFVWSTGEDAAYRIWHEGEPDDLNEEDCVETKHVSGEGIRWNDRSCEQQQVFVCSQE